MIHQKTTRDGNREIQICERKSVMDSRRICLGRIGEHPTVAYAAEELGRYLKRMDPALSVEIFPTDAVMDQWGYAPLPAALGKIKNFAAGGVSPFWLL